MYLPTDLMPGIMAHWEGRRLGLTCWALNAAFCADNYVVELPIGGEDDPQHFIISCLPNGIFHGTSMVSYRFDSANPVSRRGVEYITCDLGIATAVTMSRQASLICDIIVAGRRVNWWASRMRSGGDVTVLNAEVSLEDFPAAALEWSKSMPAIKNPQVLRVNTYWYSLIEMTYLVGKVRLCAQITHYPRL